MLPKLKDRAAWHGEKPAAAHIRLSPGSRIFGRRAPSVSTAQGWAAAAIPNRYSNDDSCASRACADADSLFLALEASWKVVQTALYPLVETGLVVKWRAGGATYVALDPAHPAALEIGVLLLQVSRVYKGFKPIPYDADTVRQHVPIRRSRRRDVRLTFGDPTRTMSLLLVYILGEAISTEVERCVPYTERSTIRHLFNMYAAFGLLEETRVVRSKKRAHAYALNESHPLVPYIKDVLAALDRAMPMWRRTVERQRSAPLPTIWGTKEGWIQAEPSAVVTSVQEEPRPRDSAPEPAEWIVRANVLNRVARLRRWWRRRDFLADRCVVSARRFASPCVARALPAVPQNRSTRAARLH